MILALLVVAMDPVLTTTGTDAEQLHWSLPVWVGDALSEKRLGSGRRPCECLNPYYQRADFDGDGRADYAVLIQDTASGKTGIAIILRHGQRVVVLGAGRPEPGGRDDFSWMDAWQVYERGPVEQGVGEGKPPILKGDALLVIRSEAASALLWWNGKHFLWYQQGD